MKYCKYCVTSSSHPRSILDDTEVCSACTGHEERVEVDWKSREARLAKIIEEVKAKSNGYDCLIPVSGGKDSFWQIVTCLEYGLNPLAITWRDPARLPIGQENLEKLVAVGVDHLDVTVNPKTDKLFLLKSFEKYGVPGIPKHMALYNMPLNLAVKFNIPLIIWGENAAIEYGDIDDADSGCDVDYAWLNKHGVTQGTTAADWVDDELSRKALTPYFAPTVEELERNPVRAIYLGYYLPWDPVNSFNVASRYGFVAPPKGPGYYSFDDVDSEFIAIHHYLKWYKFAYTRLFDNLSLEIRNGRITRDKAIKVIAERGSERPMNDIEAFCDYVEISTERFFEIAETFRNHDIWHKVDGTWQIKDFIVEDWDGWKDQNRS